MQWLHPNKEMERLESKVDKVREDTIGAGGGQLFFGPTLSDSDTFQTGALCDANACCASRRRSILKRLGLLTSLAAEWPQRKSLVRLILSGCATHY